MNKVKLVEVTDNHLGDVIIRLNSGADVDDTLDRAGLTNEKIGPMDEWSDVEQVLAQVLLDARAGAALIVERAAAAELVGNGGMVNHGEN